jgi:hypothetical protein
VSGSVFGGLLFSVVSLIVAIEVKTHIPVCGFIF